MKRHIMQYEIEPAINDPTVIIVPRHSTLLKVHSSNGEHMFAWFLEPVDVPNKETYVFYTIPTQWELPEEHPINQPELSIKYFNTIFVKDGEIIFHVFCAGPLVEHINS